MTQHLAAPAAWRTGGIAAAMGVMACLVAAPSLAASVAAIVEEIDGADDATLQPFDYVKEGRALSLGASGHLVLGYLRSCVRESITGGGVVIGEAQSTVEGGRLVRERVECDGGNLLLTDAETSESGVLVMRKAPPDAARPEPDLRVFGSSPLFRLPPGASAMTLERLDQPGPPERIATTGVAVDFAALGRQLKNGGLYRVEAGGHQRVFRVAPYARPGAQPLASRLVPL